MPDAYAAAAVRHYLDAVALAASSRFDNAGQLVGLAAECAMKQKLRALHAKPDMKVDGHHPAPQIAIRAFMNGRRLAGPWLALVDGPNRFSGWDIAKRYAADGAVKKEDYEAWRTTTEKVLKLAKLFPAAQVAALPPSAPRGEAV